MATTYEPSDSRNTKRGRELVQFRTKHRLTQAMFAELLGVTLIAVQKWESNQRGFSEPLWRLLQMFDKRPELMKEF